MKTPACPQCEKHSPSEELGYYGGTHVCRDCTVIFLPCPVCGEVVCSFGGKTESNSPCDHVVVWGVIGNNELLWTSEVAEAAFKTWCKDRYQEEIQNEEWSDDEIDCGEEEFEEYVATRQEWEYFVVSDGESHGHGAAACFVFEIENRDRK
jgi:hypothetical protein